MKGTIAILGCLLAAYAAPLFANEVPLILDETIQIPSGTYWDVGPTWDGIYYWASAIQTPDSMYTIVWGNSNVGTIDSLPLSEFPQRFVKLFMTQEHGLCIIRESYRPFPMNGPFGGPLPRSIVEVYSVGGSNELLATETSDGWIGDDGPPHFNPYWNGGYTVSAVFPRSPLPDLTENLIVWRTSTTSSMGWSFSQFASIRHSNFLDSTAIVQTYNTPGATCETNWVTGYFESVYHAAPYNRSSIYETSEDTTVLLAHVPRLRSLDITTFGHDNRPVIVCDSEGTGGLHARTESEVLWSLPGNYAGIMAYVLIGEGTEQFLRLDTQLRRFDIIVVDTGEIWGHTSAVDAGTQLSLGYNVKLVGRYHNETRRLVVRYGGSEFHELRIYRFGDPILDADDARPELPSELTLSAYPNPFNPTTMIAFDLPKAGRAKLVVYDLNGRQVQTLLDEQMSGGRHEFGFDGAALPSGIYFARLSAGDLSRTHKLVLMK